MSWIERIRECCRRWRRGGPAQQQAKRSRSHQQHLWRASAIVLELMPGKPCTDVKLKKVSSVRLLAVVLWPNLNMVCLLNMLSGVSLTVPLWQFPWRIWWSPRWRLKASEPQMTSRIKGTNVGLICESGIGPSLLFYSPTGCSCKYFGVK